LGIPEVTDVCWGNRPHRKWSTDCCAAVNPNMLSKIRTNMAKQLRQCVECRGEHLGYNATKEITLQLLPDCSVMLYKNKVALRDFRERHWSNRRNWPLCQKSPSFRSTVVIAAAENLCGFLYIQYKAHFTIPQIIFFTSWYDCLAISCASIIWCNLSETYSSVHILCYEPHLAEKHQPVLSWVHFVITYNVP
jgi:hypothetical protein